MKTTKEQYNRFKKECLRIVDLLGLHDWDISFAHEKLTDAYAELYSCSESSSAFIKYTTQHIGPGKDPEISARHEMAHLIVARLRSLATARFIREEEIETENERIANILSKLF